VRLELAIQVIFLEAAAVVALMVVVRVVLAVVALEAQVALAQ
jgi:hypothetical protein